MWDLIPKQLERDGRLTAVLRATVERLMPGRASVTETGVAWALPTGVEGEVLGIVREALSNADRHAGVQASITVNVAYGDQCLDVCIDDDGAGFDIPTGDAMRQGRFGFWSMRERAARIGGRLDVVSKAGTGTCITVSVPRVPGSAQNLLPTVA